MIISLLAAFFLTDIFAFYALSTLFHYSWPTALRVAYAIFAYVFMATWLVVTNEWAETSQQRFIAGLHRLARRWMWGILGLTLVLSLLLQYANELIAPVIPHHVEVVNTWNRQDIHVKDMGSDSFSYPVSAPSPVLRDVENGKIFYAFVEGDSMDAYRLNRNRGLEIESRYCKVCPKPDQIRQARVFLQPNWFGKYRIVQVDQVDFDALPRTVQESAVRRMGNLRAAVLPLSHLRTQHPELSGLIDRTRAHWSADRQNPPSAASPLRK